MNRNRVILNIYNKIKITSSKNSFTSKKNEIKIYQFIFYPTLFI